MACLNRLFDVVVLIGLLSAAAMGVEPVRVANAGVGGHNTAQGLSRFGRDVLEVRPQHLVIYFGMNDACNPTKLVAVETFAENLQTMIDRAKAAAVENIVLVTPNPVVNEYLAKRAKNHPCDGAFQSWLDQYDAVIRATAQRNALPIADLRKLCDAHGGARITEQSLIRNTVNVNSEDGVHLTAEGYRLMAELISSILKDKVQPGDVVVCLGDSITYGTTMQGAGTAYGETYPAGLWLFLNRFARATDRDTPRVYVDDDPGNLVRNGDFEVSEDAAHALFWRSYRMSDMIEQTQPFSGAADVQLRNRHAAPQFFWYTPDIAIAADKTYRYAFAVRGTGSIRPFIRQWGSGTSVVFPPEDDDDAWIDATDQWQRHAARLSPPAGTKRILLMFQVKGRVSLDAVSIRIEQ